MSLKFFHKYSTDALFIFIGCSTVAFYISQTYTEQVKKFWKSWFNGKPIENNAKNKILEKFFKMGIKNIDIEESLSLTNEQYIGTKKNAYLIVPSNYLIFYHLTENLEILSKLTK